MRRLLIVLAVVLLASGAGAQDFIRNYPFTNGATFSAPLLLPPGAENAPSLAFAAGTQTGIWGAASFIRFSLAGTERWRLSSDSGLYGLLDGSFISLGSGGDTRLWRDAANTLALRNGGTAGAAVPQTFNIYNFCDGAACATGYQRLSLTWVGNVAYIGAQNAGTGGAVTPVLSGSWLTSGSFGSNGNDSGDSGGSTTPWRSLYLARSIQGSKTKSLTDAAAATSFVEFSAIPQNSHMGGELICTATSNDGTDYRSLQETIRYAAESKGTAVVGAIGVVGTDLLASSNANTLACTWSEDHATASTLKLKVTCTDNTAGNQTVAINCRNDMPIPFTGTTTYP